jgi:hypothetical protein
MITKAGRGSTSRLLSQIGLVSLGSVVLLVACANRVPDGNSSQEGTFLTHGTKLGTAPARTALFVGVLYVDQDGCVRITESGRRASDGLLVVWPKGYRAARWNPLEIQDDAGKIVARQGQTIEFGGGLAPMPESRCKHGDSEAAYVQSPVRLKDK